MAGVVDHPLLVFALSLLALSLSAWIGKSTSRVLIRPEATKGVSFGAIEAATLTLLGLIIGFTFAIALSRYDLRKGYEEAEANAIGTEYLRTDLLPDADAVKVRGLLLDYLDQRILFYKTHDGEQLRRINSQTAKLQAKLWSAVQAPAVARPGPVIALAVAGMNDVLNSQGRTQAAWWDRIPPAAWLLMAAIAICSNMLVG